MDNYYKKYLNHQNGNDLENHHLQSNIFYQKYCKYKKKYLDTKKYLDNQKGSAFSSGDNSRANSYDSLSSVFRSVPSSDSISDEMVEKKSPRSPSPFKLDKDNRPVSALSEQLHEGAESETMREEDKEQYRFNIVDIQPIYLTGDYKENDIILTIYTMAFNLLKRYQPQRLASSGKESLPSKDFLKCIKEFFQISTRILRTIDQEPFLKLNQRKEILEYKEKCRILNEMDFKTELKIGDDTLVPQTSETINYNKTISDLSKNIESGLAFIKVRYNLDEARQKLVNVLK
jgi:hypothetical protein